MPLLESGVKNKMKTISYKERFARKKTYRTKQIAIRGFSRELKSRLLEGTAFSLGEQDYKNIADSFAETWAKKEPTELDFVGSSCFSKWWNGEQYPSSRNRKIINKLFPDLSAKWFDRSNFKNRMQLHLASLDLFHLSRNCSCQVGRKHEVALEPYCDKCLSQALKEAKAILKSVHNDWQSEELFKAHQLENQLSIVIFLFLLVGLSIKNDNKYHDDLILDFMTVLNCAGLILYVQHGDFYSPKSDFIEEKVQQVLFHASEYFYDQPIDLEDKILDDGKVSQKLREKDGAQYSDIVLPTTHISGHAGFKLAELFFDVIHLVTHEQSVDAFMESVQPYMDSKDNKKSKIDAYFEPHHLQIFKSLEIARNRYLKQFEMTGYTDDELISELKQTICRPF